MNAPMGGPSRAEYEPMVRAFLPQAVGDELTHRSALLYIRDRAMAAKSSASEEAYCLLDLVERTASRDAFRGMPVPELTEIRTLLNLVVALASRFDRLFAPELPMEGDVDRV